MQVKAISWAFPLMLVLYETAAYLANDMYLPSLPTLASDFGIDNDMAQWTMMIWFLGASSMQLILGPLSDRFGRRVVLIGSAGIFVLSSIVGSFTADIFIFYLARFVQGMCVCAVGVAGYAAIHELYDSKRAIQIMAVMGSITLLAPSLGPVVGAGIIYFSHWRWVFYLLSFMGLLSFVGLFVTMPETKQDKHDLHVGKILKDYWAIISHIPFLLYSVTLCLHFMSFIAWIVESPFVIMETYGKSELEFGMIQLIIFGQIIIGSQVTRWLVTRMSPTAMILLGLSSSFVAALGLFIMNVWVVQHLYYSVVWMSILAFGSPFCFGALNRGAVDTLDLPMGRRMAVLSSIMSFFAVLATGLVTLFNDSTLDNLSILIALPTMLSYLLWRAGMMVNLHLQKAS